MRTEYYIIASIIGWGTGSFFFKFANNNLHPIMVSTVGTILYMAVLPVLWFSVKFDHAINISGAVYTVLASVFMCVGTLGFSYALRSGGDVGTTSVVCALYPALTLVLSVCFLGETFSLKKIIGIILAFISVAILSIK